MEILKRLLFAILTPLIAIYALILFFGAIFFCPIYWIVTGENEDDWENVVCGFALSSWKLFKLDRLIKVDF